MKTKSNKTLWIVLGLIIAAIAIFSITSCILGPAEIKTSEFHSILTEMVESADAGNGNSYLESAELDNANAPQIKDEIAGSRFNMNNGAKVTKLDVDISNYNINCENAVASSLGNKYYLALKINFNDDKTSTLVQTLIIYYLC